MLEIPAWLAVDCYSFLYIGLLLFAYRIRIAARTPQKRYIVTMLLFMGVLFFGHMLGQLATPGFLLPGIIGNFLSLSLDVGILTLWQAYCEIWAGVDDVGRRKRSMSPWLKAQVAFLVVNIAFNVVGLFTGWFFFYDAAGVYQRGPLFVPHVVATIVFTLLGEAYIYLHRDKIPSQAVSWLAFFPVAPFVGGLWQLTLPGLPFEFVGMLFSVSLLHVFVQERDTNTDFLTGVANRRRLDIVLDTRARRAETGRTFSAVMVDVDKFKQINDTYGHSQGDAALVEVANLLARSFRSTDLVARYGGDEFFVVTDIESESVLKKASRRMRDYLDEFNASGRLPFALRISMGYGVYDPAEDHSLEGFKSRLDSSLYEEKKRKAAAAGEPVEVYLR